MSEHTPPDIFEALAQFFERLGRMEAQRDVLLAALKDAADGLRNDFEPDNQSARYHRAMAVIANVENRLAP